MASENASPSLPRILCLHGGGTSAVIFKIQLRNLCRALRDHFRFIFLDAPYLSPAGPGVLPVFADVGPYYRWMPVEDYSSEGVDAGVKEQERGAKKTRQRIMEAIRDDDKAIAEGDSTAEPGPVVAVVGFSMGGRMTAGLLADTAEERAGETPGMPDFKFGVMLCASYPPYSLTNASKSPSDYSDPKDDLGTLLPPSEEEILKIPSVHVRGLLDSNLERGRRLSKYFKDGGVKEEMEFEMYHNLPQAAGDTTSGGQKSTNEIADAILRVWSKAQSA